MLSLQEVPGVPCREELSAGSGREIGASDRLKKAHMDDFQYEETSKKGRHLEIQHGLFRQNRNLTMVL